MQTSTISSHQGRASRHVALVPLMALCWAMLCAVTVSLAHAQATAPGAGEGLQGAVQDLLKAQTVPSPKGAQTPPWRVEVVLGQLDPRLKLAPCQKVKAYMPSGMTMWGSTRVGLRCEQGPVRWNVFWPVTVKVWGQALVATQALPAGKELDAADLRLAEVDLAARASPAVLAAAEVAGRALMRPIEAGQSLREADLKARRWFEAGDPVRLNVRGAGFMVASEGVALSHGDEGRCARVRTGQGRVVCAQPTGDRVAELIL